MTAEPLAPPARPGARERGASGTAPARREAPGLHLVRALPLPQCEPQAASSTPPAPDPAPDPAQCALSLLPEPRAGRALGGWRGRGHPPDEDDDRPRRTPAAQLPDPAALVTALVPVALEVISGSRPASQLVRLLSTDAYADLQRRAARAARTRGRTAPTRRAQVRRVLATAPRDGVVEASVVVHQGQRVRAVAVRIEGWDGRWRVTALEVG